MIILSSEKGTQWYLTFDDESIYPKADWANQAEKLSIYVLLENGINRHLCSDGIRHYLVIRFENIVSWIVSFLSIQCSSRKLEAA